MAIHRSDPVILERICVQEWVILRQVCHSATHMRSAMAMNRSDPANLARICVQECKLLANSTVLERICVPEWPGKWIAFTQILYKAGSPVVYQGLAFSVRSAALIASARGEGDTLHAFQELDTSGREASASRFGCASANPPQCEVTPD